jgi:hypothetical protein
MAASAVPSRSPSLVSKRESWPEATILLAEATQQRVFRGLQLLRGFNAAYNARRQRILGVILPRFGGHFR